MFMLNENRVGESRSPVISIDMLDSDMTLSTPKICSPKLALRKINIKVTNFASSSLHTF